MNTDYLQVQISWVKTADAEFPFSATGPDGKKLIIRLNDFPEEPMYTLLCESEPLTSFDEWPQIWTVG
ncbi:UNVERIFIED_ORG: hypothetical protein J2W38_006260 [Variovorax paradoxus]|jgi:hypothetical protein|nr:hypothetical protein [Variovorax paradoxus]